MFGNPNLKLPTVAMFLSKAFLMGELFRTPSPNILKKCAPLTVSIEIRNTELKAVYTEMRSSYASLMDFVEHESGSVFDVQLLSELIAKMKCVKAAGLDELCVEHLIYCHPVVVILLCKLFNFFVSSGHIPASFAASYNVPIPKINVKKFYGSLTTVVRAQNNTSKTANITDTIFDRTYWY